MEDKHIWEEFIPHIPKVDKLDYGYIDPKDGEVTEVEDEAHLYEILEKDFHNIHFITTPELEEFVLFGTSEDQIIKLNHWKYKKAKKELIRSIFYTCFFSIFFLFDLTTSSPGLDFTRASRLYMIAFGILPLLSNLWEMIQLMRIRPEDYEREFNNVRFNYWMSQNQSSWGYFLPVLLLIFFVYQLNNGFEQSILDYGLVKDVVRAGEYGRIFTCIFLHGGFLHILFNGFALLSLSFLFLKFNNFFILLLAFVFSGLLGSMFSIWLYPEATSVGASGGIMGIIGYFWVVAFRFHAIFPRQFEESILSSIILTAFLGLAGYDFIDNGAHLGGLLGGMFCGLFVQKQGLLSKIYREGNKILENKKPKHRTS